MKTKTLHLLKELDSDAYAEYWCNAFGDGNFTQEPAETTCIPCLDALITLAREALVRRAELKAPNCTII